MKRFSYKRYSLAGIDIGSSKICCWIGMVDGKGDPKILGASYAASQGVFSGNLTDISALEKTLMTVLYEAEQKAKIRTRDAILTLSGAFFSSDYHTVTLPLVNGYVTPADIQMVTSHIMKKRGAGYHPLHIIPLDFEVDEQKNVQNPKGMRGKEMTVQLYVLWIYVSRLNTLLDCLKHCQVNVINIVFSGYSAALSCLVPDEQELGATLVDIGASGTTISCFFKNKMVASHFVPLGGYHVTQDIARGCETSLLQAERIKILYGAAMPSQNDHREMISLLPLGERDETAAIQIARSFLINIVQARIEEIMRYVRRYLEQVFQQYPFATQRIILTGGGSQTPGLRERAHQILERPVRIAKPLVLPHAEFSSADFSAVIGTFFYTGVSSLSKEPCFREDAGRTYLPFKKISTWLRKNL